MELTQRESQVLRELMLCARAHDQDIARKIKTSRPTVARIRKRLEQAGIITGYQTQVAYEKIGLHVNAIIIYRWDDYSKKKDLEENIRFIKSHHSVIMFIRGSGIGSKTKAIISVHERLREFEAFLQELQEHWGENVSEVEVFLSSIDSVHKQYFFSDPVMQLLDSSISQAKGKKRLKKGN